MKPLNYNIETTPFNTEKLKKLIENIEIEIKHQSEDYARLSGLPIKDKKWFGTKDIATYFQFQQFEVEEQLYRFSSRFSARMQEYLQIQDNLVELISCSDDPVFLEIQKRKSCEEIEHQEDKNPADATSDKYNEIGEEIFQPNNIRITPVEIPPTPSNLPEYFKNETELMDYAEAYGVRQANCYFPRDASEKKLSLPCLTKNLFKRISTNENMLSGTGKMKIFFLMFIIAGSSFGEYFIYKSILQSLFHLHSWGAGTASLFVLSLSKLVSVILYGTVKKFIQSGNRLSWKEFKTSRFFYAILTGIFIYTSCLGVLFHFQNERKSKIQQYQVLQIQQFNARQEAEAEQEYSGETAPVNSNNDNLKLTSKMEQLENEIFTQDTRVIILLKAGTTAISSGFLLIVNALLINVLLLMLKERSLRKKLKDAKQNIIYLESRFSAYKNRLSGLRQKAYRIYKLKAKKEFLTSILIESQVKESGFKPLYDRKFIPKIK
ncbi:hypothetical protein [Chryseobacterium oryctis]|uniref:Transmembrane protein n=1 Tax=Chryseobacterium oryctis TaxID=2952618 RepID=A0ABT3HIS8_9FLAO|nr:hypothetical protein [Chryseobacterium oryctis]MCW3159689.1 hypothetical protein [Chryseobacterium oryctis]